MPPRVLWEEWWYGISTVLRSAFYMILYRRAGACKQCGRCCRHVYLRERGKILSSFDEYLHLLMDDKKFRRFEVKGEDSEGLLYFACSYVTAGNTCGDYENRPLLCRAYPDLRMTIYGAVPKDDCGFYFINRFTGKKVSF